MKTLRDSTKPISHIFHISDIHIRLFHRQKEYDHVFQKFYAYVSNFSKGNHIIVITGDILHSKNELSPECCQQTLDFLQNCAALYPTLFILGNHDCLLNNLDRIDSLSSILYERTIQDLYFLRSSDVYLFDNIAFYVDSLIDDLSPFVQTAPPNAVKIALYHGQIDGWINASHFRSPVGEKTIHDFPNMDFVLLGDIHKYQHMTPTMAYAGSLISQNFGEFDEEHGVLVWDIQNRTSHFVILENPFRHLQLFARKPTSFVLDHSEFSTQNLPLPSHAKVKVFSNLSNVENKETITNLKSNFPKCQFHLHTSVPPDEHEKDNLVHPLYNDQQIVADYIAQQNIPENDKAHILQTISTQWMESSLQQNFTWELLKVSFSNMFAFGPNNVIEFPTKQSTIVGIFGPNSHGKSTIIEIITVLLFGKITRFVHGSTTPKEIINFSCDKANGSIEFRLGKDHYVIEKHFSRTKSQKIKVTEKFFRFTHDEKIELTDEQRKKTDKFIQEIIGKYDIFAYTNLFLQQKEKSFRDFSPVEKKKFLFEIFGYLFFESFEKITKEKIKHQKILENNLYEKLNDQSHETFETQQRIIQNQASLLDIDIQQRIETRDSLDMHLKELYCKLQTPIQSLQQSSSPFSPSRFLENHTRRQNQIKTLEQEKEAMTKMLHTIESLGILTQHEQFKTFPLYQKYSPLFPSNQENTWISFSEKIQIHEKTHEIQETLKKLSTQIESLPLLYVDMDCVYASAQEYYHDTKQKNFDKSSLECFLKTIQKKYEHNRQRLHQTITMHPPQEDHIFEAQSLLTQISAEQKTIAELTMILSDFLQMKINPDCSACQNNPYKLKKQKCLSQKTKIERTILKQQNRLNEIFQQYSISSDLSFAQKMERLQTQRKEYQKQEQEKQLRKDENEKLHQHVYKVKNTIALLENKNIQKTKEKLLQQRALAEHKLGKLLFLSENKIVLDVLNQQWKQFHRINDREVFFHFESHEIKRQRLESRITEIQKEDANEKNDFEIKAKLWETDKKIFLKIKVMEEDKDNNNKTLQSLQAKYHETKTTLELLLHNFSIWKNDYDSLQQITNDIRLQMNILKIIDKDGLPLHLLKQKMSVLQDNVNAFCQPFLPRTIRCRIVQNNIEIGCETPLQDTLCNYVGGMESFIIDIAFKMAFAKLSMVPKSNFFIIDEGISVLDKEHLHNIDHFFAFLSSITQNILLISHIPQIKDYVDSSITIKKSDNFSQIQH